MGELSLLGRTVIIAEPTANQEVFKIEVQAENRDGTVKGETKEGETIDQFILRLKGMMKAMFQEPLKKELRDKEKEKQKQDLVGQVMGKK